MARADDVERYLGGVQHVTAHAAPGYQVTYTQYDGQAPTTPPAEAVPWTVQATGVFMASQKRLNVALLLAVSAVDRRLLLASK
jgi:hypothetical protein